MCTRLLPTELTLSLPSFELMCDGTYLINILDVGPRKLFPPVLRATCAWGGRPSYRCRGTAFRFRTSPLGRWVYLGWPTPC